MPAVLPVVHLLTCPARVASVTATLASWKRTDWAGTPRIYYDGAPEREGEPWGSAARAHRLTKAFAFMLRQVLATGGDENEWLLFLEDDLEFHPRLGSLMAEWQALDDPRCGLASLFNPSLPADAARGTLPRAFAAAPANFLGAQALLLRRYAAQRALDRWDLAPGLTSQRLVRLFGGEGPIWVHRRSLVQHVATDSSWGARVQRALDFDPGWVPTPDGPAG